LLVPFHKAMTLQEAKSITRHLGLTLRKVRSGDYRVNFRDGNETTAYWVFGLETDIQASGQKGGSTSSPGTSSHRVDHRS
jgi:hypothetical protein